MYTNAIKKATHCIEDATERITKVKRTASGGMFLYSISEYSKLISDNKLSDYAVKLMNAYIRSRGAFAIKEFAFAACAISLDNPSMQGFRDTAKTYCDSITSTLPSTTNSSISVKIRGILPHLIKIDDLLPLIAYCTTYYKSSGDEKALIVARDKLKLYFNTLHNRASGLLSNSVNTRNKNRTAPTSFLFAPTGAMLTSMCLVASCDKDGFEKEFKDKYCELCDTLLRYLGEEYYLPFTTKQDKKDTLSTLMLIGAVMYGFRMGWCLEEQYDKVESCYFEIIDDLKLKDDLLSLPNIGSVPSYLGFLPVELLSLLGLGSDLTDGLAAFCFSSSQFFIINKDKMQSFEED